MTPVIAIASKSERTTPLPKRATSAAAKPKGGVIRTYLDISTAHVTEIVMQRIATVPGVIADPTPYGAWLWVPADVDNRIEETDEQIPQCVIDIWRYARARGCDHVHLECDADTHPELPTYDW